MEHINELFGGIAPQEIINYAQTNQDLDKQELKDYITRYKNTHIEIDRKWYPVVPIMPVAELTDDGLFYATANTCKTNIDLESYFKKSDELESLQATEDITNLPQYQNLKEILRQDTNFSATDFIPESNKNEIHYSFFIGKQDNDAADLDKIKNLDENSIRNNFLKSTKFANTNLPINQINHLNLPTLISGYAIEGNETNENQTDWRKRPSMRNIVKNFHYICYITKNTLLNSLNNNVFNDPSNAKKLYFDKNVNIESLKKTIEQNLNTDNRALFQDNCNITDTFKKDLLTFCENYSKFSNILIKKRDFEDKINEMQLKMLYYQYDNENEIKDFITTELANLIFGVDNLMSDGIEENIRDSMMHVFMLHINNYFHLIQATMTATMIIFLNMPPQVRENIWENYSQFINNLKQPNENFKQTMENQQVLNKNLIKYIVDQFIGNLDINQNTKESIYFLPLSIFNILDSKYINHVTNLNFYNFSGQRSLKDGFIHNNNFCLTLYDFCKKNKINTAGLDQPPENYILSTHTFIPQENNSEQSLNNNDSNQLQNQNNNLGQPSDQDNDSEQYSNHPQNQGNDLEQDQGNDLNQSSDQENYMPPLPQSSKKTYETIGNLKIRILAAIYIVIGAILFAFGLAAQFATLGIPNFASISCMTGGGALMTAGAATFGYDEHQMSKNNSLNNTKTQHEIPASSPNIASNTNSRIQPSPGLFPPNFDISTSTLNTEQINYLMNTNNTWFNKQTQRAKTVSMAANQQPNQQPNQQLNQQPNQQLRQGQPR